MAFSRRITLMQPAVMGQVWTPKSVRSATLLLDLDASSLSGADDSAVTSWADKSGNGHNATEATNPPVLKLNIVNGKKVVRFNGSDQFLTIAQHADFNLAAPWHAFLVYSPATVVSADDRLMDKASAWGFYRTQGKPGFVATGKAAYATTLNWLEAGLFKLEEHIFDGSYDDTICINGWPKETKAGAANPNTNTNNITVGVQGSNYTDCDIARILLYSGTVSSSDQAKIRNYLANIYDIYLSANDVDAATATRAAAPLTTPTHDGHGETVQPDVAYNAAGWNGYKYWLMCNSYPTDDRTEALELLASADGDTWEVPAGVTNPVLGEPTVGYFHGDPCLFWSPDGLTLHCIYYYGNGVVPDSLRLTSSTDGVNWSAPVTLVTSGGTETLHSPSALWDGSQYVIWTCDQSAGTPINFMKRTCSTLTGTWSDPTACTLHFSYGTLPAGQIPYHGHVKIFNGVYYGIYTSGVDYYLMTSKDGIEWHFPRQKTMAGGSTTWDAYQYSGSVLELETGLDLIYSGRSNDATPVYHIGRTTITGITV